jgi:hypothetical protein
MAIFVGSYIIFGVIYRLITFC